MPSKRKRNTISPLVGNKETKQKKTTSMAATQNSQNIPNNRQVQTPTQIPTPNSVSPGNVMMQPPVFPYGSPYMPMPMNMNIPHVSPAASQQDTFNADAFHTIIKRLDSMDMKMSSLSSIEKSVQSINSRLNDMDQKINEIERSQAFLSEQYENVFSSTNNNTLSIDKMKKDIQKLSDENTTLKTSSESLLEEVIDLKCRSMQDNLLFYGISEAQSQQPQHVSATSDSVSATSDPVSASASASASASDSEATSASASAVKTQEDCEARVFAFCENVLKIENPRSCISIDRAHRIGRYSVGKTRPIVAKFKDTSSKMKVKNI